MHRNPSDKKPIEEEEEEEEEDWEELSLLFSKALSSQSQQTQLKALAQFSRHSNRAPDSSLVATIPSLVKLLSTTPNPSLRSLAALSLSSLSRRAALWPIIGEADAVPVLLRQLPGSTGPHTTCLLKCLNRLVASDRTNRVALARTGGLPVILDELRSCSDGSRRYLLEILTALAMLREVRRIVVVDFVGGLGFIVEAAGCGSMASRTRAAQAIGLMGITRRVRHMLVDSGAVDALVSLMRDGDGQGRIVAGNALGIVSSHVNYLRLVARAGAMPLYVELLQGSEPLGKEIAEDVFCVLAVAEENAVSIMEHLVRVLRGDGGEEAKGAALDVVWDIAMYKHSVPVARNSGAIPLLLGLVRRGSSDDLREKALRAIAQLSYEAENREAMEEENAIRLLIDLVRGGSDELREYAAEALICFAEDPLYREWVSEIFEIPSFLVVQERLSRINAAGERMSSSMGLLTVEDLASDLGFGV